MLIIDNFIAPIFSLGSINVINLTSDTISIEGNKLSFFDKNELYSLSNIYYFRFQYGVYQNNVTTLYKIEWASTVPAIGNYVLTVCFNEKKKKYGRTLAMIGDSITWAAYGSKFRYLLRNKGLEFEFVGLNTDTCGYKHEGEGGNTSLDVLNRINKIDNANYYFLLIGANDSMIQATPAQTVSTIGIICTKLLSRQSCKIYISTLLDRTDLSDQQSRTDNINSLLRSTTFYGNCELIDLNLALKKYVNWNDYLVDGLHPNSQGYDVITNELISLLD